LVEHRTRVGASAARWALLLVGPITIKEPAQRPARKALGLARRAFQHSADYAAATAADSRTADVKHTEPMIGAAAGGATAHKLFALC